MKKSTRLIIGLWGFYLPCIAGLIYAASLPAPIEKWGRLWPAGCALLAAQSGYCLGALVEFVKAKTKRLEVEA